MSALEFGNNLDGVWVMTGHIDKSSKPCSLRLVRNGRPLSGTSAQLAHISDRGGWDAFLKDTAAEAITIFIETYNVRLTTQPPERPHLRVVGGKA